MVHRLKAVYLGGVFVPREPCIVPEGAEVELIVQDPAILPPAVKEPKARQHILRMLVKRMQQNPHSETLVRAVEAAGRDHGLEVDLWSRSRLSHFLDNQPMGQWIRRSFLAIEQEQLSIELLHELSKKNLETYCPLDNPTAWIPRTLDAKRQSTLNLGHPLIWYLAEPSLKPYAWQRPGL